LYYLYHASCIIHFYLSRRQGHSDDEAENDPENNIVDYTKSIVFGGTDGILTSISVIAAAAGANLSSQNLIVMGVSVVAAGAFSMGIGEFASSKAHKEFVQSEKRSAQWEFKHDRTGRVKEMANLFEMRGMSRQDAESVVNKMAQYDGFFVNLMVTEELGLQPPEDDDLMLLVDASVMLFSFAVFGFVPLLIYGVTPLYAESLSTEGLYTTTAVVSAVAVFSLGSIKSTFRSFNPIFIYIFCS
jgi:DNA damage-binding protein 1